MMMALKGKKEGERKSLRARSHLKVCAAFCVSAAAPPLFFLFVVVRRKKKVKGRRTIIAMTMEIEKKEG
jgi:hypothetical protein